MTSKRKTTNNSARKSPAAGSGVVTPSGPRRQPSGHGRPVVPGAAKPRRSRGRAKAKAAMAGAGAVASPVRIDPAAMTVAQAAKVLSAVGVGTLTEEMIRRHIAAGAPTTSDGRINLVHYGAWVNLPADNADQRAGERPDGAGPHGA